MQYTINGKDYTLRFGIGFVRELNAVAGIQTNGVGIGLGLTKALPGLKALDPAVLSDVIYAATKNKENKSRPKPDAVDEQLESESDLEAIFDAVTKEINESVAVKTAAKNLKA